MFARLFTEHPRTGSETYTEDMGAAFIVGGRLPLASGFMPSSPSGGRRSTAST